MKGEHPFWGFRRLWAHLRFMEQQPVNKKWVLRLMREYYLLVPPKLRLKVKRTPMGSKPRPTKPNEWSGIDMTMVLAQDMGWLSIVVVLDWYTNVMVGCDAGIQCKAQDWLSALATAVNGEFPHGARGQGLSLMNDNDCQPTSLAFMRACTTLEILQTFTTDNNPKGIADTKRVIRTLKEGCPWLQEWMSPVTLARALATWIDDNEHYLHSALSYKPSRQNEATTSVMGLGCRPLDK